VSVSLFNIVFQTCLRTYSRRVSRQGTTAFHQAQPQATPHAMPRGAEQRYTGITLQQVLSRCYLHNFLNVLSFVLIHAIRFMPYVQELEHKAAQTARLSVELEQARQQIDVLQQVMCQFRVLLYLFSIQSVWCGVLLILGELWFVHCDLGYFEYFAFDF
jgi:hypothetical protein